MAAIHKEGALAIDKFTSASQGPSLKKPRLDYSRVTKSITDIFAADPTDLTETGTSSTTAPKRILIEGAPGIGKTVLAKEIAYQWATNEILTEIKIVFLLYLRDPQLQSITTTKQLVEYVSMGCLDNDQITAFNKYLVNSKGQQLCIVMDGFDEYPNTLLRNSFIVDIINRAILPEAIVVITSRPTATVLLHDKVDRRIDILGLPKEEREKYISKIFSDLPEKKEALDKYLKQQPVINGLCFVPLHLAILLYLFQQGSLPETLTEMNEYFILHTIYRHLGRYGPTPFGTVDKLLKLPKQVLDNVHGLSVLAFNGLQENKLVFTSDEIKQACPHFEETKGAINGYGLLQAVEHFPHEGGAAGRATSLNFLHYTMQEFLSAFHVSNLPNERQSSLMKKTFWDGHYNFMWMMFIGIVGIKSDIFVNFTSKGRPYKRKSGVRIADTIKNDKRKLLHVFQCFLEAKENEIPEVISSLFKDGKVIFNKVKLLPHNVTSLMSFICSKKSVQWKRLELTQCKIGDIGMSVLQQFVSENTSTLEYVDLRDNNSSPWGVYCAIIRHCSVDSLTLCGDKGIEDYVNQIKDCLQMNTKLISLKLCNITDNGAKSIDEAIQVNTTLHIFDLSNNSICDNAATAIGNILKHNILLQQLNFSHNKITDRGIKVIAEAIQMNSTLQNIDISKNHISTKGLLYFMEAVKNKCTLQVVNITHNNVTRSGFTSIKQCVENLQNPIQIIASWNEIVSRSGELLVKSMICTLEESKDITEDVWSFEDYDCDQIVTCLSECLEEDDMLLELHLSKNKIINGNKKKIIEAIKINKTLQKLDASFTKIYECLTSDLIKINKSLKELNISNNSITSNGAKEIATAIRVNTTLENLDLSCNMLSDEGASFISEGLKRNIALKELNMSTNHITSEGIKYIAEIIQVNTTLEKLDISCNMLSDEGASFISEGLKRNIALTELNMSTNKITSEGIKYIAEIIQVNSTLEKLDISCNMLSDEGASFISEGLKRNIALTELNMSTNKITSEGAKYIAEIIQVNSTLEKLDLSDNAISNDGAIAISDSLQFNISLQELSMSRNEITSEGTKEITTAIKVNDTLKQLDLSINKINDEGANFLSDGLKNNISLLKLNISHNNITDRGIKVIAEAIQMNSTLQNINISKNHISTEGLLYFMEAVKNNCTLQVVNITHNNVTRSGFTSLKQCIENLQHSVQIIASWNEIREGGKLVTKVSTSCVPDNIEKDVWSFDEYDADHLVMCLSECLKEDDVVQKVELTTNYFSTSKITSEGAIKIAEAIKVNKTLQELYITNNNISDDGAAAISNALKSNNSLQILGMSWNKITSEGAKSIAKAIKVNTTLHTLYLYQYDIDNEISFNTSVLTAVYHNNTLMTLKLPWVYDDNDRRLVRSEVEMINKERTTQGISTLSCSY